jgi:hypothetical protein
VPHVSVVEVAIEWHVGGALFMNGNFEEMCLPKLLAACSLST